MKYTIEPYEEEKQGSKENIPVFQNSKKHQLKKGVPVFTPSSAEKDKEDDDFQISELKKELNPNSKAFTPSSDLPKDKFADLGPSENDMNV